MSDAKKRVRKAVRARRAEYPAGDPNVEKSCGIGTAVTA
jgi:hypothetical protein